MRQKRLTRFEIMRRNRRRAALLEVSAAAAEAEREWNRLSAEHRGWRDENFKDTGDWLAHMRAEILPVHRPKPKTRRRWWQFWKR